jgi:hypothetical protein
LLRETLQVLQSLILQMDGMVEPKRTGAFQPVVFFDLTSADPIHRLTRQFAHMKLVMDDLDLWRRLARGRRKAGTHVHGCRFDLLALPVRRRGLADRS